MSLPGGVFTLARGGLASLIRPWLQSIGFFAAGVVLALVAIGYGLSALRRLMIEAWGPIDADLMLAAAFVFLSLACAGVGFFIRRRRARDRALEVVTARLLERPPITARRLRPVMRPAFFAGLAVVAAAAARAAIGRSDSTKA